MKDEKTENILKNLNYSMQRKTYKLMELKIDSINLSKKIAISRNVFLILGIYIAIFLESYLNSLVTIFRTPNNMFSNIAPLDLVIFLAFIFSGIIWFIFGSKNKNVNESYNALRKDIIKSVSDGFCTCNIPCSCKDNYIKTMESYGIDLVFTN